MNNIAKVIGIGALIIVGAAAVGIGIGVGVEKLTREMVVAPFTAEDAKAHSTRIDPIKDTTDSKIRYLESEIKKASDNKEREVYSYLGVGDNREKITSHFRSLGYDVKLETTTYDHKVYYTKIFIRW